MTFRGQIKGERERERGEGVGGESGGRRREKTGEDGRRKAVHCTAATR
jgi:hypothetical protein